MTIKTTKNKPNSRGDDELNRRLRSLWLGMRDSNPQIYYHPIFGLAPY